MSTINPEHRKYIDRIRELWVESGGKLLCRAEDFGLNPYHHKASESGSVELLFDYGAPVALCVAEGSYTPLGSCVRGDADLFRRLLSEVYTVHVVRPQLSDAEARNRPSGPLVALIEKADAATRSA